MGLTFTMEEQPDLTIPEDTICRARLEEIKPREFSWTDQKTGELKTGSNLEWWWLVTEGDHTGRRVRGTCDKLLGKSDRNKFTQWAEALLDREIPLGMVIDVDDLVGLSADISIRHDIDKKDPTKRYERVDEVIPLRGGSDSNSWSSEPPF